MAYSNEIKEFGCFQPGESLFAYDGNRDVYVETSQRVGQGIPGDKTGTLTQEGEQNSAESGGPARRVGQAAGAYEGEQLHVKPGSLEWLSSKELREIRHNFQFNAISKSPVDEWRQAQVARQQAGLLDELAADAVAPASEQGTGLVERLRQQLVRRIEFLERLTSDQARQIAALRQQIASAMGSAFDTARVPTAYDDHIAMCKAAMAKAMDVPNPMAVTTVPLNGKTATMLIVDDVQDCEHDALKPNTTVSVITRKKSRCTVCAQVWELP